MSALKVCPQCGTEYELDQRFCPRDGTTLRVQGGGDLVGQIVADRYHVLKKLGEGGMGAVYLAEHVKMGRKSAVKVMNPGMASDADAISRFNREAANASRINHPNVCAVYDFGETSDGLIYLAMEFIEGPSLSKLIEELGALPAQRAADITRQAAEALAVAHDMGIVHRDLKPDNIMIARNRDGSDCVKVVDFGIAKAGNAENQKVTRTGMVVGTPEYMSPEQLAGDKLDGRSDTYSLALVAFNMFTGKLPFPGNTVQESMILRLTDRPRTLAEMKPEVSWTPEVQAVMDRALARDVGDRYQNAAEFGRELERAVQAMPESDATNAFTAVMTPVSAPAAKQTTPIPATRVNTPTPVQASSGVPARPTRSRAPMLAGIAALVLVLGGGGAWYAMQGAVPDTTGAAAPQGELLNRQTEAPPVFSLSRSLTAIRDQVDDSATAASVLDSMQRWQAALAQAPDTDYVHFHYLRGRALSASGDGDGACTAFGSIEGKAKGTRFEDALAPLLKFCLQQQ